MDAEHTPDPATQAVLEIYKRFDAIENRLKQLEADRENFMAALDKAAVHLMDNKMVRAMMPEDMRSNLEKFIALRKEQNAKAQSSTTTPAS